MSTHTSLDAAATERKARLAKLKSLKRKQPADEEETAEGISDKVTSAEAIQEPTKTYLSGRNYDTEAKGAKLGFEHAPNADISTLEIRAKEIADETAQAAAKGAADDKGIDLFKLQPKKPNWDLKRDLAKKMEILNVRTDNAIAWMVRERIAAQQKAQKEKLNGSSTDVAADGEEAEVVGLKGEELVEGIHQREREEAEEAQEEDDDERI